MSEEKINEILDRVNLKKMIEDVYTLGFNDGLGIKLPTQQEFDEAHKVPNGYGEESEWLVLSVNLYNEDEAVKLFKKHMIDNGWYSKGDEELTTVTDTIRIQWISYKLAPNEQEPMYWIGSENMPTFWRAWVVETQ